MAKRTQKDLVPDRGIPELEEACSELLDQKELLRSTREKVRESESVIQSEMKANKIRSYTFRSRKFYIEPGSPRLKIAKEKTTD